MRAMPVVEMRPGVKLLAAFVEVLICPYIGPSSQRGLNEALRLAVGARRVGSRKAMLQAQFPTGLCQAIRAMRCTIIGQDRLETDAQPDVIRQSRIKKRDRRSLFSSG